MSSSVDVLAWWMPRRGGDALVWRWMPGRGGECSGVVTRQGAWGATLLAPLWQSCVGVGVVPHHVAGGVVLCRIAMLARSASSASCGSCSPGGCSLRVPRGLLTASPAPRGPCPQGGECVAGVGCALEGWASFDCVGFVCGGSSRGVWQSWCQMRWLPRLVAVCAGMCRITTVN